MARLARQEAEAILDRCLHDDNESARGPVIDDVEHEALIVLVRDREKLRDGIVSLTGELRVEATAGALVDAGRVIRALDLLYEATS